jgi:NADH-quinone oxidoreductase subunit L
LIGFYFREPKAVAAAMKAFIITRIGDVFLLFGIFLCFYLFKTLNIANILSIAKSSTPDSALITIAVLCLLGGAAGKSAQLPLSTWLSEAMWGPTPVSALIHAATMVTAGVYLLVRMGGLVALSPVSQIAIAIVGLLTLLMAGLCAVLQNDVKRVLAYSTMSQIGYMFLAIGVQAFHAAIFHLTTHAFFKALLFLSAGVIGHAYHTYDLRKLGGLHQHLPSVFVYFLVGSASLMGLPLLGAGFFSKEWILTGVFGDGQIGAWAYLAALVGSFLTGLYTCRMLALLFGGQAKEKVNLHYGMSMKIPLLILAIFTLAIGWLETPFLLGDAHYFSWFLTPAIVDGSKLSHESWFWIFLPSVVVVVGGGFALRRFRRFGHRQEAENNFLVTMQSNLGLDWLIAQVIVVPYNKLTKMLSVDVVMSFYQSISRFIDHAIFLIQRLHTGRLSHYLSFMMVAMVAIASVMVWS